MIDASSAAHVKVCSSKVVVVVSSSPCLTCDSGNAVFSRHPFWQTRSCTSPHHSETPATQQPTISCRHMHVPAHLPHLHLCAFHMAKSSKKTCACGGRR